MMLSTLLQIVTLTVVVTAASDSPPSKHIRRRLSLEPSSALDALESTYPADSFPLRVAATSIDAGDGQSHDLSGRTSSKADPGTSNVVPDMKFSELFGQKIQIPKSSLAAAEQRIDHAQPTTSRVTDSGPDPLSYSFKLFGQTLNIPSTSASQNQVASPPPPTISSLLPPEIFPTTSTSSQPLQRAPMVDTRSVLLGLGHPRGQLSGAKPDGRVHQYYTDSTSQERAKAASRADHLKNEQNAQQRDRYRIDNKYRDKKVAAARADRSKNKDARNAQRRDRYRVDAEYRDKRKAAARANRSENKVARNAQRRARHKRDAADRVRRRGDGAKTSRGEELAENGVSNSPQTEVVAPSSTSLPA